MNHYLIKSFSDSTPASGGARTIVEETYLAVRREILEGTLAHGTRLRLEGLRTRYGISMSTVREALTRLIGDRLVVAEGQKGFRVAPMSLADIGDLTKARSIVECAALAESVANGGDDWEDRLVAAYHRLSRAEERLRAAPEEAYEAWERQNLAFHAALVAASRSRWLEEMRVTLFHNSERYRRLSATKGPVPVEVHEEHKAIFDAAMSRDGARAVEALRSHIARALTVITRSALLS